MSSRSVMTAMHGVARNMHQLDQMCRASMKKFSASEIKAIRIQNRVSQSLFARCLNVRNSTVKGWEQGWNKHQPNGPSLKLLNLVAVKGLDDLMGCSYRQKTHSGAGEGHALDRGSKRHSAGGRGQGCVVAPGSLIGKRQEGESIREDARESARDLYEAGLLDEERMREIDLLCRSSVRDFSPEDIKHVRIQNGVGNALFAVCLSVSYMTIRRWEQGESRPSGPSLRLLNLAADRGVEFLLRLPEHAGMSGDVLQAVERRRWRLSANQ